MEICNLEQDRRSEEGEIVGGISRLIGFDWRMFELKPCGVERRAIRAPRGVEEVDEELPRRRPIGQGVDGAPESPQIRFERLVRGSPGQDGLNRSVELS